MSCRGMLNLNERLRLKFYRAMQGGKFNLVPQSIGMSLSA